MKITKISLTRKKRGSLKITVMSQKTLLFNIEVGEKLSRDYHPENTKEELLNLLASLQIIVESG